jgi:hypothetical protein
MAERLAMGIRYRHQRYVVICKIALASFVAVVSFSCPAANSGELPSATNVLHRLLQRASQVSQAEKAPKFNFSKRSITQELNSRGGVISSTEKKYKVVLVQGWAFERLVEVEGKQLTETELRKEDQREKEFRNRIAGRELKKRKERREAWITPELLARYHFTVLSNDVCQNRKTIVLAFKPKPGNPEETIEDKICNRCAGLLWVDSDDAEIAKLEVHLRGELSLGWMGMLGSLKECHLTLLRQRLPEGVWVNAKHVLHIVGRKLVSTMRFRSIEESSDFHPGA